MANINREIYLGVSGVAVFLLGLVILLGCDDLSAPTGERKRARIHENLENLEAIFSALQSYASDNGGNLPSSLGDLVERGYLDRGDAKDYFSDQDEIGFELISAGGTWDDRREGSLVIQTRHNSGEPFFVLKADGTALALEELKKDSSD